MKNLYSIARLILFALVASFILPISQSHASTCYEVDINGVLTSGYGCSGNVVIDTNVTSIGPNAFWGHTGIVSVTIPNSIVSIGNLAFAETTNLETVTIGTGLKVIAASAFQNSSKLSTVIFDEVSKVTEIRAYAFAGTTSLTSISLPNTLTSIGESAFQSSGLTSLIIPNNVTTISKRAFFDNNLQGELIIPNSVVSIGDLAFYNNPLIETVTVGSGVTTIGERAFFGDPGFRGSLKSLTFGDSLNSIGDSAFQKQPNLISLTIPNSVKTIGVYAFYGAESLTSLSLGSGLQIIDVAAFGDSKSLVSLTIPDAVTEIRESAFQNVISLVSLNLGNSLKSIGMSAFESPHSLISIDIPDSVTSVGDYAFRIYEGNNSLTSITLGNALTKIGNDAFAGATNVKTLTIPDSVDEIGIGAFGGFNSLETLNIGNSIETIPEGAFNGLGTLTSLRIPDSVKYIERRAFYASQKLESLTLGSGVLSIGEEAFDYANSLTSLIIPKSVTYIGDRAFRGVGILRELRFEGSPSIGFEAFHGLPNDAEIYAPIGSSALSDSFWDNYEITYFTPPSNKPSIPIYQVSYLANAVDASFVSIDYASYANGEKVIVAPRAPVRAGYTFLGWNTAANGSGINYAPGSSLTMGNANISLYAQWKINSYTLTIDENKGLNTESKSVMGEFGSSYLIPSLSAEQVRLGYTFLGWNSAANGSGQSYQPSANFSFTADTTLYAQWKVNSYSVSYRGNGNQSGRIPANTVQEFGTSLKIQSPSKIFTRKGYTFQEWNSSPDGTGTAYAPGTVITQPANDLTLYANWLSNTYQVRFFSSTKESIPNGKFATGGRILSAPTPTARAGYIFKGWSITPARTQIITFPYAPTATRNISLYAVWEKKK